MIIVLLHGFFLRFLSNITNDTNTLTERRLSRPNLIWINIARERSAKVDLPIKIQNSKINHVAKILGPITWRQKSVPSIKVNVPQSNLLPALPAQSGSKKTLDMDGIRKAARAIAHEDSIKRLSGADEPYSRSKSIEKDMNRAGRPDCRTEHANLGILAIPFLLKDAMTERGCKW